LAQTADGKADADGAIRAERVIDHITWRLGEWGQLIAIFSADFIHSLQPAEQQPSFLKASTGDLFVVSSPDITDNLSVTITAKEKRRDAERCSLIVNADIPSRGGWPNLGGSAVTLAVGGHEIERLYTNAFGNVVFDNIAQADLARLSLTVEPS
jgi:hypothetical protein